MLLHSQFYQLLYINRFIRRLTITQINYRIHKNNCRRYSTSSWTKNLITYEINMLNNLLFNPLWRYPVGIGIFSSTGLKLDVCRKFLHPPKARFCISSYICRYFVLHIFVDICRYWYSCTNPLILLIIESHLWVFCNRGMHDVMGSELLTSAS